MSDNNVFDYIIVGGGSAGSVLANRLSADPLIKVLLLEAGPSDRSLKVRMPAATAHVIADPGMNWHYYTEPQKHLDGRRLMWPRARVLGGCSSHNTMVFIRGHARDYDHWRQLGCEGWSYADVLPYFRRSEMRSVGGDEYHGDQGPMRIHPANDPNPLPQAFVDAGQQAGFPYTADFNGRQQEGVGRFDLNIDKGNRCNTAYAYLRPALSRKNLTVIVEAFTLRLLFEGTRSVGVEYSHKGQIKQARTEREVILSCGAINSPQLLMLSGIGDPDHLREHGLAVVADLPSVGKNLQDHLDVAIQHECRLPVTLYGAKNPLTAAAIGLEWFLFRTGPGATAHLEAGSFLRSIPSMETPDIQHHFVPLFVVNHGMEWPDRHGYQAHMSQMRPESRGYLKLRSADPSVHPIIEPNLLEAEEDRRCMRDGVKVTREIMRQPAFDKFRGVEVQPGDDCVTDADIDAFVRAKSETAYHPSSTCKMGTDLQAVVDPNLRVRGITGLRVVDASIMPTIVSGNLNAPTIMIAEKATDMILGKSMLAPEEATVAEPVARKEAQRVVEFA